MNDLCGRNINYLRISVGDRCNMYCKYCCIDGNRTYKQECNILAFEEYIRLTRILKNEGIDTVRITGGEPLLRQNVSQFIADLKQKCGIKTVSLTTNGVLLEHTIDDLVQAGLDCVNISLDSVDPIVFQKITGTKLLEKVLFGIDKAYEKGLNVKINCVPITDVNEEDIEKILLFAKDRKIDVRFIELMPMEEHKQLGIILEGIQTEQLKNRIMQKYELYPAKPNCQGKGPAEYYRITGFEGSIGFISPMSKKICHRCGKIRLSSDGTIRPCLAIDYGINIREELRSGASDERIRELIYEAIAHKGREREREDFAVKSGMYTIGG